MTKVIDSFRGKYFFLSNFYEVPVTYEGIAYGNNEAAFQAQKCIDYSKRAQFSLLDPSSAKRKGRHVKMDVKLWDQTKVSIMHQIVFMKFAQNADLKQKLIDTSDAILIEGNTWGDKIWGKCNGAGKNLLGKILMECRAYFIAQPNDNLRIIGSKEEIS